MKIAINGRFLLKPFTGIGQVTKNLFGNLAKMDRENEYVFVVPSAVSDEIAAGFSDNVKIEICQKRECQQECARPGGSR